MNKSCKYCGRIHDEAYICPKKPVKHKKIDDSVRLRNSSKWQNKRVQIKERDKYLCQICIRDMYNTLYKYTYKDIQVHHAIPIHKDESLSLETSNLISLCPMHHAMCDRGEIPYKEIRKIIDEQNEQKR
ncbi:MAG: hypothetical protein RUMPE_01342 [Eubacteriales bacterium SKADARSKE-1]|nr:hypothetical protein [Eubacteriales bacterium SKADARSKE-1]MDQ5984295.1 hypothetical protein [Eubacteriales bacterium SKADARSKE-1]